MELRQARHRHPCAEAKTLAWQRHDAPSGPEHVRHVRCHQVGWFVCCHSCLRAENRFQVPMISVSTHASRVISSVVLVSLTDTDAARGHRPTTNKQKLLNSAYRHNRLKISPGQRCVPPIRCKDLEHIPYDCNFTSNG